jgi:hypothetical protein
MHQKLQEKGPSASFTARTNRSLVALTCGLNARVMSLSFGNLEQDTKMHKRTIRLAISAIMLALVVSVPVDAAGQGRAGLRQQQQQRERTPRARSAPRDTAPRARSAPRNAAPRASRSRNSIRRDYGRRGYGRRDYGRRGYGRRGFGRGIRSLFPIYLGAPLLYPNYDYDPVCARRGGVWVEREVYSGGRYILREMCVEVPRYQNY